MEFYQHALAQLDTDQPAALGIVLHTRGSTPQKAGAKALFRPGGQVIGTLGGGCLEAEAQHRALLALDEGKMRSFTVNLDEVDGWDDGLVCGGRATILTAPLRSGNRNAYAAAVAAWESGSRGALLTVVAHPGYPAGTAIWLPEGAVPPAGLATVDLAEAERREKALLVPALPDVDGAEVAFFIEPVSPPPRLVIVGAGHIGKALSHFASRVGFAVTVLDDRPSFANADNLPDATCVVCGDIEEELSSFSFSPRDFVVIVTRGHRHDSAALAACIRHELAYLGLIGSKRKGILLRERLLTEGLATESQVARVVTPMGLDLGGATVEEIALSIAAQLVSVRRHGRLDAPPLKYDHIVPFAPVETP